eukprot:754333-Hanusia_phi.AAC.1
MGVRDLEGASCLLLRPPRVPLCFLDAQQDLQGASANERPAGEGIGSGGRRLQTLSSLFTARAMTCARRHRSDSKESAKSSYLHRPAATNSTSCSWGQAGKVDWGHYHARPALGDDDFALTHLRAVSSATARPPRALLGACRALASFSSTALSGR